MSDWQSALQNFLDTNPDLPEGEEPRSDAQPERRRPRLDIILDRKGRAGKTATLIVGFGDDFPEADLSALAGRLKQRLATGGSCRGGEILIQGDRRQQVKQLLESEGFKARII